MHWLYLTLAILFEVAGTTCMKISAGFTRPAVVLYMAGFYIMCFFFLTLALKKLEIGVAYAIWSGIGVALIASIGTLCFREPMTALKCFGLIAIIIGVVALNLSGTPRGRNSKVGVSVDRSSGISVDRSTDAAIDRSTEFPHASRITHHTRSNFEGTRHLRFVAPS
jgi:small multidrug resistance pump